MTLYENVRRCFDYDPDTGAFTWKIRRSRICVGNQAGHINSTGHFKVKLDGVDHMVHRLIWLWYYGELPKNFIDHINGIPHDNRIVNLRDVTNRVNQQNQRKANSLSTTGYLGVGKCGKRWRARIRTENGRLHLGVYGTPEEAHQAYLEAKRKLHEGNTL